MRMNIKSVTTKLLFVLCVLLFGFVAPAYSQETKLKWFGHAAFSITTPGGKVLLVDPWLKNPSNPEATNGKDPFGQLQELTTSYSRMDTGITSAMPSRSPGEPKQCSSAILSWLLI